jgi:hypothetical protein
MLVVGVAFWLVSTIGPLAPVALIVFSWSAAWYALLAFYAAMLVLTAVPRHVVRAREPLVSSRRRGIESTERGVLTLVHPHGILCQSLLVMAASFPRGTACTVFPRCLLWIPSALVSPFGWRVASASRSSVADLLASRRDVYLYPGGLREAARHSHDRDVVDVGSRGAIWLALREGSAIRVAFAFGERKTAYNVQGLWPFRMWLAKNGVPACLAVPFVRGEPPTIALSHVIQLPRLHSPTAADVEHWHAEYVAELRALHAEFRAKDDELVVIDDRAELVAH